MKKRIIDDEFIRRMESLTMEFCMPMQGYFGGAHRTKSYGNTVEFADFREYVPGDDIRRIDWNLCSRLEKYFIKLFVDERQMHTHIFLDASASMARTDPAKAEYAMRVVAALGYLSVRSMDKVSFRLLKRDQTENIGGPVSGIPAYYRAIDALEHIKFEGETDIQKALSGCDDLGYDDGLSILVSDFLTDRDWRTAVDYLLFRRRQVMLIQILSPEEVAPSYTGRVFLQDCEAEDVTDPKHLRMQVSGSAAEAYRRALDEHMGDIRHFCASRGVDFVTAVTDEPVERLIFGKLVEWGVIRS